MLCIFVCSMNLEKLIFARKHIHDKESSVNCALKLTIPRIAFSNYCFECTNPRIGTECIPIISKRVKSTVLPPPDIISYQSNKEILSGGLFGSILFVYYFKKLVKFIISSFMRRILSIKWNF